MGDWSFLEEFSCASCVPHSHHSWEDFSTTHFHQCLYLRKACEYNYVAKVLCPMMPTILSEDIIVSLH